MNLRDSDAFIFWSLLQLRFGRILGRRFVIEFCNHIVIRYYWGFAVVWNMGWTIDIVAKHLLFVQFLLSDPGFGQTLPVSIIPAKPGLLIDLRVWAFEEELFGIMALAAVITGGNCLAIHRRRFRRNLTAIWGWHKLFKEGSTSCMHPVSLLNEF